MLGHHNFGNRGDSDLLRWKELKPDKFTENTEKLVHNLWVWCLVWNQSASAMPWRQNLLHAWRMVWGHGGVSEGAKPARIAVEVCLKCRETNLVQSQPCCFLDMAAAPSCFTKWLGSISESTDGHRPNQSGDVLLFRQRGQSESQLSRMLCVILLQIFNQCSQVCTIPLLSDHIPSLKHGMPREGKGCQLPPPPNSSHLGFTCPHRKLPLLLRLFPLLQSSFHDYLQRSSVYRKSVQMLQSYQMAVIPQLIAM